MPRRSSRDCPSSPAAKRGTAPFSGFGLRSEAEPDLAAEQDRRDSGGQLLEALLNGIVDHVAAKIADKIGPTSNVVRPRLLSVQAAAAYLSRTVAGVRHLVASGKIPIVKLDKRVFIDVNDLDELVEESKQRGS